jgi:hypothetical protein
MANQWPTFDELTRVKSVRSVLLEEGSGISERTGDKIRFTVESEAQSGSGITHHCYLIVPAVGYRYPLLRVVQETLDYPVTVFADLYSDGYRAADEAKLREALGVIFRSEPVKKIVAQLLDMVS